MRVKWGIAITALMLIVAAGRAVAHHSFAAEFDANKPVTLEGTVTSMQWVNPHAWLFIDVKGADSKVVNWGIEMGAPNAMIRRGWNNKSIPVGTAVIVSGFQAKNGTPTANGRDILLPDGRKLFVGSSGAGSPDDK